MAREYEVSERLETLGKELIPLHHPHLTGAKIAYIMKKAPAESKGPEKPPRAGKHPKMATARSVNDLYYCLTGFDFIIEVDEVYWDRLELDQQEALMDHELKHCARDEKGFYIQDHDLEEFIAIVRRHGYWRNGIEQFVEAAQARLPFDDDHTGGQQAGAVQ